MSTDNKINQNKKHKTEDQQLLEDEAFIDALYEQLDQDKRNQDSPSEILDKRIILAAHQAVNNEHMIEKPSANSSDTMGKISDNTRTSQQRAYNFKLWSKTIATAASLILVVSLVIQQPFHILPNERKSPPNKALQPIQADSKIEQAYPSK